MNYNNLTTGEKMLVTKALNIKHSIIELQESLAKDNAKLFELVKKNNRIVKGKDIISYVAQAKDGESFDIESFKTDFPELYSRYATPKPGAKAHIKYTIK